MYNEEQIQELQKTEEGMDQLLDFLGDQGLICECGYIMDKSRIQGEIQYTCPNCGLTEVEKISL